MEWFNDHIYNNDLVEVKRQFIFFTDSVRCQQE